jgi:hypothetical protein
MKWKSLSVNVMHAKTKVKKRENVFARGRNLNKYYHVEIAPARVLFAVMTWVKNRDSHFFRQYGCTTTAAHVYMHWALLFLE